MAINYNNEALMAAAAQMLQASGPSTTPVGLGQILGGGISTYMGADQAAKQRKLEEEQQRQMAELRAVQMQEMQGGLDDRSAKRAQLQHMAGLQQEFAGRSRPPMQPELPQLGSTPMASTPGMPAPQPAAQKMKSPYQNAMAYADFLNEKGEVSQAMAVAEEAQKLRPKVKEWVRVHVGTKVQYAPLFEDGSDGPPVDREVAEKLEFRDAGGSVVGLNAYTGKTESTIGKTATIADGLASQRLSLDRQKFTFDKSKEAKPTFNAEAGGFITPPSASNPNGGITPLAGFARPLTEAQGKASTFSLRMIEADKKLAALAESGAINSGAIKRIAEGTGNMLGLGTDSLGGALSNLGGSLTNWTQSADQQQVEQAKRDWINANLRHESGAAIGKMEFESADKQYFPQIGDDDAAIKQKAINRQNAARGLIMQAGSGATRLGLDKPAAAAGGWSIKKKD